MVVYFPVQNSLLALLSTFSKARHTYCLKPLVLLKQNTWDWVNGNHICISHSAGDWEAQKSKQFRCSVRTQFLHPGECIALHIPERTKKLSSCGTRDGKVTRVLVGCLQPFMRLLIPFMRVQSAGLNHFLKDSSFNTFPCGLKLQHEFWRGQHLNHSTCCVLFYALCIWPSLKDKCRVLSKSTVASPHGSLFLLYPGFLQANFSGALRPLLALVLI